MKSELSCLVDARNSAVILPENRFNLFLGKKIVALIVYMNPWIILHSIESQ